MKKTIFTAVALITLAFANAQEGKFKAGFNLGLPLGDIEDSYSFTLGLDAAYMWSITEQFHAGVTAGYAHYIGKSVTMGSITLDLEDAGFIPVAATAQYSVANNIFIGGDIGYAIGISPDGNDGGFLYQPKVGYQTDMLEIYGGYKGISRDGATFSSVNLGINYKF